MSYFIGQLTLGSNADVEISQEQYGVIRTAKLNLVRALQIEERFDILLGNYCEFEEVVVSIPIRHNVYAKRESFELDDERRTLNRRIINLLSSCRLYLDQMIHDIAGIFGDESDELVEVKSYTNNEYDAQFSYRLMEALRNYVQHRGLAANSYSVTYHWTELNSDGQLACTVTPELVRQELSGDKKVKSEVRKELQALSKKIDLKPHIRSYIESLCRVHCKVRDLLEFHTKKWEGRIVKAINDYKVQLGISDEKVPAGLALYKLDDESSKVVEREDIFLKFIDYRKVLENRNTVFPNISARFATGQQSDLMKSVKSMD